MLKIVKPHPTYLVLFVVVAIIVIALNACVGTEREHSEEKNIEYNYIFQGGRIDNQQTARAIAATELRNKLLYDALIFLYPKMQTDSTLSAENVEAVEAVAAGIVGMETLEEKWDSNAAQFRMRARMVVDSTKVKRRINEILVDEQKTSELVDSRRRVKATEEKIQKLRIYAEQDTSTEAVQAYQNEANVLAAEEHYITGMTAQESGAYEAAIKSFANAIAIDSTDIVAYNNMGLAYVEMGNYKEAIKCYQKATTLDSTNIFVLNNLGNAFSTQKLFKDAAACYQRVIAIDSTYIYAYNNLGNAYDEMKLHQQAIRCYEKALAIDPNFAGAHSNMGVAYASQHKYTQAIKCYQRAIDIDPDFAEAYNNMGYAYSALRQYKQAAKYKQQAIERDPRWLSF
jgi:tetratricopeptide (TPR) repeat protein